jgi:hypothetical protein
MPLLARQQSLELLGGRRSQAQDSVPGLIEDQIDRLQRAVRLFGECNSEILQFLR